MSSFQSAYLATVLASVSGSISIVSSCLCMIIILRGFSIDSCLSVYHRIIFFTSFGDLLTSLAITLSTLPMPKDLVYDAFHDSTKYGNTTTCSLQGFLVYAGSIAGICSICILCFYYLCVLKFGFGDDGAMHKNSERISYILSVALSCIPGLVLWRNGLINPHPYEPYCFVGSYPYGCREDGAEKKCVRGGFSEAGRMCIILLRYYLFSLIIIGFFTVVSTMASIVSFTFVAERAILSKHDQTVSSTKNIDNGDHTRLSMLRKSSVASHKNSSEITPPRRTRGVSEEERSSDGVNQPLATGNDNAAHSAVHSNAKMGLTNYNYTSSIRNAQNNNSSYTKAVVTQAGMYILTFILTWFFYILAFIFPQGNTIAVLKAIFFPLKGFFNSAVFLYHKIHNLRQAYPEMSTLEAGHAVLFNGSRVPEIVISRIELVLLHSVFNDEENLSTVAHSNCQQIADRRRSIERRASAVCPVGEGDQEESISNSKDLSGFYFPV